ncbi:protein of unassigned function [Methylobacterium oryzae CBMB20]|uniref:Protein of unassigned function n=1 Tax=Methylobacterium oryzae CBMB20 TaxID=693986 RepID=A0A089P154_9HYPH|nr:protein of unassigned function [Methylobacterium oryzae CBMB20]
MQAGFRHRFGPMKALRFLRIWLLISIPLGLLVGRFIKVGKGPPSPGKGPR